MKKLLLVSLLLASIGFAEETANYKKTTRVCLVHTLVAIIHFI